MKILFVASLHHPEALRATREQFGASVLFPPSMSQHFWEKALRKRGHTLDVFWRNNPGAHIQRHSEGLTPGKVVNALLNRVPPQINPEARARNVALIAHARAFRPDLLWMVGDNTVIYPETLAAIQQETGCLLLYATGTSPIVFSRPIDRAAMPLYDLALVNDYYHGIQLLELGAKRMECLPISACDPDFHHPYALTEAERAAYACDIAFVGTLVPDHLYSQRVRALEALTDFDLGIWSVHDVPPSLRKFVRGSALGEEMIRIISAAKLCLNTHGDFMRYGGNMRLFEVAGAGICQLSDDLPGTRLWFPEIDGTPTLIAYANEADLRAKAAYYLAHDAERQASAQAAQAHVYAEHTYDRRAERLDQLLTEIRSGDK
ncbi:MAG: glycosyltransferase [Chloroflexi bacterium]|nr:glycosyltransferase [Chloroflexota bacterium]